jgi:uncharacterized protein (TIGR03435 family)
MIRSALILVVLVGSVAVLAAQTQNAPGPSATFEVVSIKPAPKVPPLAIVQPSPNRFYRANITLQNLINYAYDMRGFRIIGGPDWVTSDRWEVSAKADTAVAPAEMPRLVQRVLADRFALKVHSETRVLPIYNLVLARSDGRLGPQMKPAEFDCEPFFSRERRTQDSPIDAGTGVPRCATSFRTGPGVMTARYNGTPASRLAVFLSTEVDRLIVDKTGLSGSYDIELTYQNDRMLLPGAQRREAPALFTAVQEQLGLKLEPARGPVEVLVIDSVSRPTPD